MAVLFLAVLLLSAMAHPMSVTCAPALERDVCHDTVQAALQRGLPELHPLILLAHVEPGPQSAPGRHGHRATVAFHMLAVPGPADVRLFSDMGGHWGGTSERATSELAAWSVAVAVGASAVLAAATSTVWPRRPRRARA